MVYVIVDLMELVLVAENHWDNVTQCAECTIGWSNSTNCTDCDENHFGKICEKCTVDCKGHGHCNYGVLGSNTCICNDNYDSETNCESKLPETNKFPPYAIALIAVGGVLVLGVLIFVYRKNRKPTGYQEIN